MRTILVTDIFGENNWTDNLMASWRLGSGSEYQFEVISPYNHRTSFECESDAYQAFVEAGGMEALIEKLSTHLRRLAEEKVESVTLVGFSAGAAAIWCLAAQSFDFKINHVIGFYPGQIRRYLDLAPNYPVSLFFPNEEAHFELPAVIDELKGRPNCRLWQNELPHGFVNPQSSHYHSKSSGTVLDWLRQPLALIKPDSFSALEPRQDLQYKERV